MTPGAGHCRRDCDSQSGRRSTATVTEPALGVHTATRGQPTEVTEAGSAPATDGDLVSGVPATAAAGGAGCGVTGGVETDDGANIFGNEVR